MACEHIELRLSGLRERARDLRRALPALQGPGLVAAQRELERLVGLIVDDEENLATCLAAVAVNAPWARKHDMPGTALIAPAIRYPRSLEDLIEICVSRSPGTHLKAAGSRRAVSVRRASRTETAPHRCRCPWPGGRVVNAPARSRSAAVLAGGLDVHRPVVGVE